MRICFIAPSALSLFFQHLPPEHGGAEVQLFFYASELAKNKDLEIHFILQKHPDIDIEKQDGVHFHYFDLRGGLKCKLEMQVLLSRINADVYIQRCIGSLTKEIAFFSKWRRKKFIYWVGSNYDVDLQIQSADFDRNDWFFWGMKQASRILLQTNYQGTKLKENFNKSGVVIRNGFPLIKQNNTTRDKVLWVSHFIPMKRPEFFIQLAKEIPTEKFVLIGPTTRDISKPFFEKYEQEMKDLENFEYISGVPMNEINQYYESAKLFVNTSEFEGFPNTFLQAMVAGTPIASLDFDPDQIIEKHQLGIAPTFNLEKFIVRIKDLLGSESELKQYGENCMKYVSEHHDISRNAEKLLSTIRSLI